jgi:hypothetical protein
LPKRFKPGGTAETEEETVGKMQSRKDIEKRDFSIEEREGERQRER